MAYGYGGKILHIDLNKCKVTTTPTSEYARLFVGGRGLNAKLMFDFSKPGVDAFHPDNPVIIGAGALAGSGIPGMSHYSITSRSPEQVPQGLAVQSSGGSLPSEMKYAGYDHIVIKGSAKKPTYIHIENEHVAFKNASGVWGKGTFETDKIIREELGDPEVKVAAIGQAGERLVRFATIEHENRSGTGIGSVWGAKNLKAIAVRGTRGIKIYDPEAVQRIIVELIEKIKEEEIERAKERGKPEPSPYRTVAANCVIYGFEMSNVGLVGYLEGPDWPDLKKTMGEPWLAVRGYRGSGCCPVACSGVVTVPGIGSNIMRCYPFFNLFQTKMIDLDKMFKATMLMSDYGMDTRNLAMAVSYLMKLYEMGIITTKDTEGIPMEWGSGDALIETVHKVARREGFGNVLADGPLALAKSLGPDAEAMMMHTRGQIAAGDERRNNTGYALAEAISTRRTTEHPLEGYIIWEDHWKKLGRDKEIKEAYARAKKNFGTEKAIIPWTWEGKPTIVLLALRKWLARDLLGACGHVVGLDHGIIQNGTIPTLGPEYTASFNAVTGLDVKEDYLMTAAERMFNVEKAYAVREGLTRDDDTIAEGWHKWPIANGPYKGMVVDKARLEEAKSEFYRLSGWNVDTGWPLKGTYERLMLSDVAQSLDEIRKTPPT